MIAVADSLDMIYDQDRGIAAIRVGIILPSVAQRRWIRWLKSTIQHRLMRGVGIIL